MFFRCDSDIVSFNVAYSFYKVQLGQVKKVIMIQLVMIICLYLIIKKISYVVFESEKNRKIYNFEKIYSKGDRSIYLITRK